VAVWCEKRLKVLRSTLWLLCDASIARQSTSLLPY
jgi:hypothetical protein